MKKCSNCKIIKINDEFYKDSRNLSGLQSQCKTCFNIKQKKYNLKNKNKLKEYNKSYYSKNKISLLAQNKNWVSNNRKLSNNYKKRYQYKNKSKYSSYCAKRRACKLQQTPSWITKNQLKEIEMIYFERDKLNEEAGYIKYHVDHIIPLQGETCRGLHVPWNLQILEASNNSRKKNKV